MGEIAKKRKHRIKVFGERNTGTRAVMEMVRALEGATINTPVTKEPDLDYLEEQIKKTIKGFHRELYVDAILDVRRKRQAGVSAWKHAAPVVDDSYAAHGCSVLFLVRDPYSWIKSLTRRPYHIRAPRLDSVEDFIQRPWLCMERDNIDRVLISPMNLWNEKLRAYLAFAEEAPVPSTVLHFENFVIDPVAALGQALARFGVAVDGLREIDQSTKNGGRSAAERREYYKNAIWKRELTPRAARLVNQHVDWGVAANFGYNKQAPEDFGR